MKISFKQVLAVGALAVASTSAFADVALPNTGNGELTLVVYDQTTGASYARGLQVNLDSIATTSTIAGDSSYVAGEKISYSLGTVTADANLTAFLSEAGSADTITWAVVGGATSGTSVGAKRYVTTTAQDLAATNPITNAKLTTSWTQLGTWEGTINGAIENSNGGASVAGDGLSNSVANTTVGAGSSTNAGWSSVDNTWAGTGVTSGVALGTAANFYLVANSSTSSIAAARIYTLTGLTLSTDGTLSSAPVPVPAALWLLGSGLAGLVGIGRRKQVVQVA